MLCASSEASAAATCAPTPEQTEGPYYPAELEALPPGGPRLDLTRAQPQGHQAEGQVLYLIGRVLDQACRPVAGAVVEVWQASANGRYAHPRDRRNPAPLDPSFRYRGKAETDSEGRFRIKTVKPGSYQAGRGWIRPPHLHMKVHRTGTIELTTQVYFHGDAHQDGDYILQDVPPGSRARVIVSLEPPADGMEPQARLAHLDLVVEVRSEHRP